MNDNQTDKTISGLALVMLKAYETSDGDMMAVMAEAGEKYPDATQAEFETAAEEVAGVLRAQARQAQAEADALDRLAPLFDGMPEGIPLGECARIKAERGDPLAIEYLKWEAATSGAA